MIANRFVSIQNQKPAGIASGVVSDWDWNQLRWGSPIMAGFFRFVQLRRVGQNLQVFAFSHPANQRFAMMAYLNPQALQLRKPFTKTMLFNIQTGVNGNRFAVIRNSFFINIQKIFCKVCRAVFAD